MKRITLSCLLFLLCFAANAQTQNEKIKVILIGTFHFGATTDKGKTSFPDLFSASRQNELDSIAHKLAGAGVLKYFVETPVTKQKKLDSLYALYTSGLLTDTTELRDEQIQIAFRSAVINNAKLVASDSRQELPYDLIQQYEETHKNDTVNLYPFFEIPYPFLQKQKKLNELSLPAYYIQLNNAYNRQARMFDYIHYALGYGQDENYVGESFTLSWYDRNLKIFTNILRSIDVKKDKTIAVLFGSSHTAVLRSFFQDHPYFELVELEDVLN